MLNSKIGKKNVKCSHHRSSEDFATGSYIKVLPVASKLGRHRKTNPFPTFCEILSVPPQSIAILF